MSHGPITWDSRRVASLFLAALLLAIAASCERPNGFEPRGAVTLTIIGGGSVQTAKVDSLVSNVPEVLVRDANGDPVAGVLVSYYIELGGGTIYPAPGPTGPDGRSKAGYWRVGSAPGPNRAAAFVSNSTSQTKVTFEATAIP